VHEPVNEQTVRVGVNSLDFLICEIVFHQWNNMILSHWHYVRTVINYNKIYNNNNNKNLHHIQNSTLVCTKVHMSVLLPHSTVKPLLTGHSLKYWTFEQNMLSLKYSDCFVNSSFKPETPLRTVFLFLWTSGCMGFRCTWIKMFVH